jgi:transcriptional regulator with XRE-family HTH domain
MTDRPEFDLEGFYRTLDATRHGRGLNWKQVGQVTGVSASTLSRMTQGKRPDADALTALAAWAGMNPAEFVRNFVGASQPEPLAVISQQLRRDPNLSHEAAEALDEMIKSAYRKLAQKKE